MNQETKTNIIRISLMLAETICLFLAAYVAYQMYQYNQGWHAGIEYAKSLNNSLCYFIIKSGS